MSRPDQALAFFNLSATPLFASLAAATDLALAFSARTAATHETNSEAPPISIVTIEANALLLLEKPLTNSCA